VFPLVRRLRRQSAISGNLAPSGSRACSGNLARSGNRAGPVTRKQRFVALVLTSLVLAVATVSFPAYPAAASTPRSAPVAA
jgi:hypothetical protein